MKFETVLFSVAFALLAIFSYPKPESETKADELNVAIAERQPKPFTAAAPKSDADDIELAKLGVDQANAAAD